ncbi:hypothetical protein [Halobacteriovorax sp. RT-2-6]|uniref:hypothetical protein n=1 Tax=unclassified Halobacteriovorax TaxID=2639665 RepID=UPI003999A5CB
MSKKLLLSFSALMALNTYANYEAKSPNVADLKNKLQIQIKEIKELKKLTTGIGIDFRGDVEGNGGDVLVCNDGKYVELLDIYEGRYNFSIYSRPVDGSWKIDLGSDELSVEEKVFYALNKIKDSDIKRFQIYSKWATEFFDNIIYVNDEADPFTVELPDISDSGNVILPKNCELKQIAIQRDDRLGNGISYYIDSRYWKALDNNHKAALVLHEVIYRDFRTQPEEKDTNSMAARYYNSLLVSDRIDHYSSDSRLYNELLNTLGAYQKVDKDGKPRNQDESCVVTRDTYFNGKNLVCGVNEEIYYLDANEELPIQLDSKIKLKADKTGFYNITGDDSKIRIKSKLSTYGEFNNIKLNATTYTYGSWTTSSENGPNGLKFSGMNGYDNFYNYSYDSKKIEDCTTLRKRHFPNQCNLYDLKNGKRIETYFYSELNMPFDMGQVEIESLNEKVTYNVVNDLYKISNLEDTRITKFPKLINCMYVSADPKNSTYFMENGLPRYVVLEEDYLNNYSKELILKKGEIVEVTKDGNFLINDKVYNNGPYTCIGKM